MILSKFFFLFFLIVIISPSFAQKITEENKKYLDLSYEEIDSFLAISLEEGTYNNGILLMKAGRNKAKQDFGEQDSTFSLYTSRLSFFYNQVGEYNLALSLSSEAIEIQEKVLGKESDLYANTLSHLAEAHLGLGDFSQALLLYNASIDIEKKVLGASNTDVAISINNLAFLYLELGNFDRSLQLFNEAKDIQEKELGRFSNEFATTLGNIAAVHCNMGNFNQALPLMNQVKDIDEKNLGKEHPDLGVTFLNLAELQNILGNYDQALPLYKKSMEILEKSLGKQSTEYVTLLNNLAGLYRKMNNNDQALIIYTQSKEICIKVYGKEHPSYAKKLNSLATLHAEMGNFNQALSLFKEVIGIKEKTLGQQHTNFVMSLNDLADLYRRMGHYNLAWDVLILAFNNSSSIIVKPSFDQNWVDSLKQAPYLSNRHIGNMLTSLSHSYDLLREDSAVSDANSKLIMVSDLAIALLERQRNQTSIDKDKLRLLAESNEWLDRSLKLLSPIESSAKAFSLADQNKSVLLLQATRSETTYRLGNLPDSLAQKDKENLKKRSVLQAQLTEKRSKEEKENLRNELNQVNETIDEFLELIKVKYPEYYKLKYEQVDAKLSEVQALLDENTALIEYVISDSVIHIFLVDKTEIIWSKFIVGNDELKERIKKLHDALSSYEMDIKDNIIPIKDKQKPYSVYTDQAFWFYQNLVAPVVKNRKSIQNLVLVTDGELGHLPFETFLATQAPQQVTDYHELHYLVKDYNISYNYSATLWKNSAEAILSSRNNGKILAMAGNYDLKLDSSLMNTRLINDQILRKRLMPLPAARREVEMLQKKYQGFFAFDALASEKTMKAKASEFAILHLATHGLLDADRPALSSIAFTEDNDSIESNFWQAHEISKLELNADLVVLSACETGYGKFEKGNGIASLARAFMYAGASSLIVSLWEVNDYTTSLVMNNLYENLANGMRKDEALRHAKLQYIKSAKGVLAHPAFWSPFIQMGNVEPVNLKKKSNSTPWMIGLGVLVLLGLGVFFMKRKNNKPA